ncbi:MAG: hypothetical protein HQ578_07235 [Chloroflexi bacterium]|nr:hypothetical protein [Chloroflexota bacterium]
MSLIPEPSSPESVPPVAGGHRKPRVMAAIPCFNEERFIGTKSSPGMRIAAFRVDMGNPS